VLKEYLPCINKVINQSTFLNNFLANPVTTPSKSVTSAAITGTENITQEYGEGGGGVKKGPVENSSMCWGKP